MGTENMPDGFPENAKGANPRAQSGSPTAESALGGGLSETREPERSQIAGDSSVSRPNPAPKAPRPFLAGRSPTHPHRDQWQRLARIAILIVGAGAFRALIPYEPFPEFPQAHSSLAATEDWFFRPTGQSPALIFLLSACFLYTRYRAIEAALARPRGGIRWAIALFFPGMLLYAWATHTGAADLLLIALVFVSLGAGATLGGNAGLRAGFLPAIFLLLLVPIPAALANHIVYALQLANAQASAFILNDILGISASAFGTVVTTEGRNFQVIESCAGLRTVSILWMSAIVYCDLFQRSRAETALLLLAAPLIGAAVNLGRVLSLMLNPAGEIVAVHTLQGIVMTVVGVLLLAALDSLLVRQFPADSAYLARWNPPPKLEDRVDHRQGQRGLALLGVVSILAASSWLIRPWQPTRMINWSPYTIPLEFDGWRGQPIKTDEDLMGSVRGSHWIHRIYTNDHRQVELFLASDDLRGRHTSLLSPLTVLPAPDLSIREQRTIALEGVDAPVVESLLRGEFKRVLSYRWILGESNLWRDATAGFIALEHSDFVAPAQRILVRISTPLEPAPTGLRRAEDRLEKFSTALAPWLGAIRDPEPL
jgi:exosortase